VQQPVQLNPAKAGAVAEFNPRPWRLTAAFAGGVVLTLAGEGLAWMALRPEGGYLWSLPAAGLIGVGVGLLLVLRHLATMRLWLLPGGDAIAADSGEHRRPTLGNLLGHRPAGESGLRIEATAPARRWHGPTSRRASPRRHNQGHRSLPRVGDRALSSGSEDINTRLGTSFASATGMAERAVTHRQTAPLGLRVSVLAFSLFALLAWSTRAPNLLSDFDTQLAQDLARWRATLPDVTACARVLTEAGAWPVIVMTGSLAWLTLSRCDPRWLWAWLPTMGSAGLLNRMLKACFHEARPSHVADFASSCFPSGHALFAVVGYGMLAYLVADHLTHRWQRAAAVALGVMLVLGLGFSRVYLAAHCFSDVAGGFAVGIGWLAACIAIVQTFQRHTTSAPH
jgi:membrane-associated phospholipid phosphatase